MKVFLKYDLFQIETGNYVQKEIVRDLQYFLDRLPSIVKLGYEFTLHTCRDIVTDKEYKIVEDITYGGTAYTVIPV